MLELSKIVNLTGNETMEEVQNTTTTPMPIPVGLAVTFLPVDEGSASTGFMILAGCMVFFMVPGLALFYSGLSRHTNALSLMMLCMQGMAVVIFQFFVFGFSLAFSTKGRTFVGDFASGAYNNLDRHSFPNTSPAIPAIGTYYMDALILSTMLEFKYSTFIFRSVCVFPNDGCQYQRSTDFRFCS